MDVPKIVCSISYRLDNRETKKALEINLMLFLII